MVNSIVDIAQQLWTPAKHLHQQGISYHTYLTELSWLLFLKVAPILDDASNVPTHLSWDTLIQKSGQEQYEYYQEVIKELGQISDPHIAGIYAYARTSLEQPEQLAQLITTLTVVEVVPIDDLGEIYETLLEKCGLEDNNSLHVAPRSLVNLMVILTQPQAGELVQDPLAGTASFVVAANEYIQVMSDDFPEVSLIQRNINNTPNLIAIEPDLARQRLALMNCLLHHIEQKKHIPVRWGDSLLSNLQAWPLADVILSTLVFASSQDDELGKHDTSLALLQHVYQTLKPGGRATVALPDKVLKAAGPAEQVRSTLLDTCVLHTVLRLPRGIFYPRKISAHLLFFRKGKTAQEKTQTVWFYDLRSHFPTFGQYLRLTREHLLPFERIYGDDPLGQSPRHDEGEKGRWRCFSRDTLAKLGDRLDLCWLQDEQDAEDDNTEEVWEVLDETVEELEGLIDILRFSENSFPVNSDQFFND